jgi:hypothetical protein
MVQPRQQASWSLTKKRVSPSAAMTLVIRSVTWVALCSTQNKPIKAMPTDREAKRISRIDAGRSRVPAAGTGLIR